MSAVAELLRVKAAFYFCLFEILSEKDEQSSPADELERATSTGNGAEEQRDAEGDSERSTPAVAETEVHEEDRGQGHWVVTAPRPNEVAGWDCEDICCKLSFSDWGYARAAAAAYMTWCLPPSQQAPDNFPQGKWMDQVQNLPELNILFVSPLALQGRISVDEQQAASLAVIYSVMAGSAESTNTPAPAPVSLAAATLMAYEVQAKAPYGINSEARIVLLEALQNLITAEVVYTISGLSDASTDKEFWHMWLRRVREGFARELPRRTVDLLPKRLTAERGDAGSESEEETPRAPVPNPLGLDAGLP